MTTTACDIAVVLPTYNRLEALKANFGSVLSLEGIAEIVIVVDGADDGTLEWLNTLADPRVQVVSHTSRRGAPAARNTGIDTTRRDWVLMLDDDCWLPSDFATTLLSVAEQRGAAVVGAPWLHLDPGIQPAVAFAQAKRRPANRIGLTTHPSAVPADDVDTPFLCGNVLVSRAVFGFCRYDPGFRGNSWREETDLFLSALLAGFRCTLTPRTASFQTSQWTGGQRFRRAVYEAWVVRNNWRFLRRHEQTLRDLGEIDGLVRAQLRFLARRWWGLFQSLLKRHAPR